MCRNVGNATENSEERCFRFGLTQGSVEPKAKHCMHHLTMICSMQCCKILYADDRDSPHSTARRNLPRLSEMLQGEGHTGRNINQDNSQIVLDTQTISLPEIGNEQNNLPQQGLYEYYISFSKAGQAPRTQSVANENIILFVKAPR